MKRTHDEMSNEPENLALQATEINSAKKVKETVPTECMSTIDKQQDHATGEMDLEDLIAPSTVIKTGVKPSDFEKNIPKPAVEPANVDKDVKSPSKAISYHDEPMTQRGIENTHGAEGGNNMIEEESKESGAVDESCGAGDTSPNDGGRRGNRKKGRKSSDEAVTTGPRRELRSSVGRSSTESNTNH